MEEIMVREEFFKFFWDYAEKYLNEIREQLAEHDIKMSEVGTIDSSWITDNEEQRIRVVIELIDGGIIPREYFAVGSIPKEQKETVGVNINFRVHTPLEEDDGIIYDVIPYNYTGQCWLPITDRDSIIERLDSIFERFTIEQIVKDIKEAV